MVNQGENNNLVTEKQNNKHTNINQWLQHKLMSNSFYCSKDLLKSLDLYSLTLGEEHREAKNMYQHIVVEGYHWDSNEIKKLDQNGSIFLLYPNAKDLYSKITLQILFKTVERMKLSDVMVDNQWIALEYRPYHAADLQQQPSLTKSVNYIENIEVFSTLLFEFRELLPITYADLLETIFGIINIELNNINSEIMLEPVVEASDHMVLSNQVIIQYIGDLKEEIKSIKQSLHSEVDLKVENERQRAELTYLKDELERTRKELSSSTQKLNAMKKRNDILLSRYHSLKDSKLGKMTILYWKVRNLITFKTFRKALRKLMKKNNKPVTKVKEKFDLEGYLKYRDEHADVDFYDRIKSSIEQIPVSNGSKFYPKMNVKIGIIADELLYNSYQGMADFIYITKENFANHVEELDVFFVVSAWKGLNSEWRGLANPNNETRRRELLDMINECKQRKIKVVFYSKEDPVNYDRFVSIAKHCDYIFTTAKEKIDQYKVDCNTDKVGLLSFGVNPIYHNPVGMWKCSKLPGALFAGSWYEKYLERQVDTEMMFDGLIESGNDLKIIDRNYALNLENHLFPKKYVPYISPALEHDVLQKVHKLFNWSINLNSIKYSETMFANRVYELQAIGNLLLSNYSTGINNHFPNVYLIHSKEEVGHILNHLSEEDILEKQVLGVRTVMSTETTYQRLEQVFEAIEFPFEKLNRRIAVLCEEVNDQIQTLFNKQTYKEKTLFTVNEFSEQELANFDMVTFFAEDKDYGEFYLEDMINAFKYTNSDYITKDAIYDGKNFIAGREHDFVSEMKDKYRTVFWTDAFSYEQLMSFNGATQLPNGYSIDRFEYNNQIKQEVTIQRAENYKLSVIVPAYNNGKFLLNKCFESLKRSSLFADMEIIIVDDGSTDGFTPKIIQLLEQRYDNVKTYFYGDGGSGSASRPRNKGVQLATADYVTYLDPDNEAVNDGYYKLYNECINGNYDIVMGNILKVSDKAYPFRYDKYLRKFNNDNSEFHNNAKQIIIDTDFKSNSIQALVVKKHIIIDHDLRMVEGAAGQDTVFFYELMLNSEKGKVIDLNIHIYYAAVEGSTVNAISKRFYEKYYKMEQYKIKFLEKNDLLSHYMENKFGYYFKNWFLKKLKNVNPEDAYESVVLLSKILDLYLEKVEIDDEGLERFIELNRRKDYDAMVREFTQELVTV